ncbi:tRNA (adenosine(37)-N6)-dimethylallyltransferase MiaA [Taibaiella soli]|uniref:tRNA dimethylallyltransferase n=1 Tax=Taibaiella soli TaxID=1649169 RepID=A0A2W2AFC2_9BACT|nr:tRNA (adenosine(37)-N6)-dimethylallyltransferase MiaA [Taibaiella soli]PZF72262.1 tRNA (adenosine(37)-N6)-dimethylallyltransferase MiaA [Taibaiella soli]
MPTAYIIAGPTAVGKTAISIRLAQILGTSVVSADSRQCYKGMEIGTAQPTAVEMQAVPHYFIDVFPPETALTAADYEQLSLEYLQEIFKQRSTAVVCGGTGLYIKALCEGLDEMPEMSEAITAEVNQTYQEKGTSWLQEMVQAEDPAFFATGEIQNPARLMRALIFKRSTGKSITEFRTGERKARPFKIVKAALELPRPVLYDRINRRVDIMMEEGLLKEAEALYPKRHLKNLQTVGYSELFDFFEGKYSLDEAVDKIKQHTRHYAKRQMTWFKKDPEFRWFQADDEEVVKKICEL